MSDTRGESGPRCKRARTGGGAPGLLKHRHAGRGEVRHQVLMITSSEKRSRHSKDAPRGEAGIPYAWVRHSSRVCTGRHAGRGLGAPKD